MGKIFINKSTKNTSVGGVSPSKSNDIINKRLQELKNDLAPQKKQETSLDNIDAVIGRPNEKIIPRDLLIAAPKEWNFFPKASDEKIQEFSESIRQYGLFHNITVWARDDGKYMILGGHTRVACFDYLASTCPDEDKDHWTKIPALVYQKDQLSDIDAQRIIIVSNTNQRDISKMTKAKAYLNLLNLEKKKAFYGSYTDTMASAAAQVNLSKMGFFKYLQLLHLIPELQNLISTEQLTVSTAYHLSFMPILLQKYIFDNELYHQISHKAAEQIKKCETIADMLAKLNEINSATKYYKYQIQTRHRKTEDEEILPLWIEKNLREEITNLYSQAVIQSDFPQEIKDKLVRIMNNAN